VFKALALGADAVMIAGCHPGDCHYIEQNYKTIRRVTMLHYFLEEMGIEKDRLRLVWASAAEGQYLAEAIDQLVADTRQLGPLTWTANWQENGERLEALENIVKEHEEAMEVCP
jgi:F420-non-reducing hydrogenase iron-sulfur subunit